MNEDVKRMWESVKSSADSDYVSGDETIFSYTLDSSDYPTFTISSILTDDYISSYSIPIISSGIMDGIDTSNICTVGTIAPLTVGTITQLTTAQPITSNGYVNRYDNCTTVSTVDAVMYSELKDFVSTLKRTLGVEFNTDWREQILEWAQEKRGEKQHNAYNQQDWIKQLYEIAEVNMAIRSRVKTEVVTAEVKTEAKVEVDPYDLAKRSLGY